MATRRPPTPTPPTPTLPTTLPFQLSDHWAVGPLFAAWAAADVVRYAWYTAALAGGAPGWLTWLRYSAFIPLYPLGIFGGELPIIRAGLPYIRARRLHSVVMPNAWNFAFSYAAFCVVGATVLLPAAFVQLYAYMLRQRRARLGRGARAA